MKFLAIFIAFVLIFVVGAEDENFTITPPPRWPWPNGGRTKPKPTSNIDYRPKPLPRQK